MDVDVLPEAGGVERRVEPSISWPRLVGAVVIVWVVSALSYLPHLTAIPAVIFFVATIVLVPLGSRYADRLIVLLLVAVLYISVISWVSPFVPLLVHPAVLTAILGTPLAICWARGRLSLPKRNWFDLTSIATFIVSAALWSVPFLKFNLASTIGQLAFGPDNSAHMGMMRGVWFNHGYEMVYAGHDRINAYLYQSYPETIHAMYAAVGSVLLGTDYPPDPFVSIQIYAVIIVLTAGLLAFSMSWATERLTRHVLAGHTAVRVVTQLIPPVMLVIGPLAWVLFSSASYIMGLFMMIIAAAFAATATRSPRRLGVFVAIALICMCYIYPLLVIVAPMIWLLYIWRTKTFWLRHRAALIGATVGAAVLASPMLIMLAVRDVDHGFDSAGVFEPIPIAFFVGTACGVAGLIGVGGRALPKPVLSLSWMTGILTGAIALLAIVQFVRTGAEQYYAIKSMYASLCLSLIVLAAAAACLLAGWQTRRRPRKIVARLSIACAVCLFLIASAAGIFSVNSASSPGFDNTIKVVPGFKWITSSATNYDASQYIQFTNVSAGRVPIFWPCDSNTNRWLGFLSEGGMYPDKYSVYTNGCDPDGLLALLKEHPNLNVDLYLNDPRSIDKMVALKKSENLTNLRIVSIDEAQARSLMKQQQQDRNDIGNSGPVPSSSATATSPTGP